MAKDPEAKITVKMFNDDFKKGAKELTKESQTISREFKLQSEQMKLTASETEKLEAKMEFLSKKHDVAKRSVQEHEQAYEQAKTMFGENSQAAEDMAKKLDNARIDEQKLANEVELTNRALQSQQDEAGKTSDSFKDMGTKIKEAGEKVKEVGDGMTDAGARMTAGITAPILGIGAAAMSAWGEVDDGLDTIVSKTGASGEALESLEQSFKNVATTSKFDMQQVGDAIGEVNTQFGLMGPELDAASLKMLKFADINGADVAGSSIKSKQAMDAFGLSAEELDMALDSVTLTAQNTGQSTDKLFDVVTKGAPQLKAMGLDFAQSVEVMGQFEKAGVDSSTAMSYLSRAQITFAKDGLTMQEGLDKTIKAIEGAKTETEAMTIAAEVFGTKGATRMVDAIQRGTFNFDEFADAAANSAGVVEGTFEGMADPIDQVNVVMNNLKLAGAELFGTLQELLLPVGLQIIEMLQGAVEWFMGLSDGMKTTIVVVAGIAAAIGPLLVWLGTLVSTIGTLMTAFGAVSAAITAAGGVLAVITGPIGIAVAAITGLIAVVVLLVKNWDTIKEKTTEIWKSIQTFLSTTIDSISKKIETVMQAIKVGIDKAWNSIEKAWMAVLKTISKALGLDFDKMKDSIQTVMDTIKQTIDTVWNYIRESFQNVLKFLKSIVTGDFQGMKDAVKNQMGLIKETIGYIWDDIKTVFSNALRTVLIAVADKFTDMIQSVRGKMNDVLSAIKNIWQSVTNFFTGINLYDMGKDIIQGLINGVKAMADRLVDSVKGVVDGAIEGAKRLLGIKSPSRVFMEIGGFTTEGFADGIESMLGKVRNASKMMASAAIPDMPALHSNVVTTARTVAPASVAGPTVHQEVHIHSPKHVSPSDAARLQKRASEELALAWR